MPCGGRGPKADTRALGLPGLAAREDDEMPNRTFIVALAGTSLLVGVPLTIAGNSIDGRRADLAALLDPVAATRQICGAYARHAGFFKPSFQLAQASPTGGTRPQSAAPPP